MGNNSGIYEIVNLSNGHKYIGSAVNIPNRWREHKYQLIHGKHHSQYLQRAWDKYSSSLFLFHVLEYCEKDELITREQFYIDLFSPEYNISPTAGNCLGVKASEETKKNISDAQKKRFSSDENRRKHSVATSNRTQSVETRKKISVAFTGRKLSAEWKNNISDGKIKYMHPVLCFSQDGNFVCSYRSVADAEKATGTHRSNIRKNITKKTKHSGGYVWKYADEK